MAEDFENVRKIFDNFEAEFSKFKTKSPDSLILKFFKDRGFTPKHANSKKGHETIGVFKNGKVNGSAFVIYGVNNVF